MSGGFLETDVWRIDGLYDCGIGRGRDGAMGFAEEWPLTMVCARRVDRRGRWV